jgi:ABC-type multidrug transport system permease subunit
VQIGVEIPYMLIQVFIFSSIVYPMVGFQLTVTKFFWFVLYMILSFTDYTLYGMMAVALTPNIEIASGLSFLIFMIWNVFSGFIVARKVFFFSFFNPLSSVCISSTHTSGSTIDAPIMQQKIAHAYDAISFTSR